MLAKRDYLNKMNLRNRDNTDINEYNCGGLALNTFSWYKPYKGEEDEMDELIWDFAYEYRDIDKIANKMAQYYISVMLEEFENLRLLSNPDEVVEGERLIAFRVSCEPLSYCKDPNDMDDREIDSMEFETDFHFRYYEDEHWWEKTGQKKIRLCDEEMANDDWEYSHCWYNSDTFYLGLKM